MDLHLKHNLEKPKGYVIEVVRGIFMKTCFNQYFKSGKRISLIFLMGAMGLSSSFIEARSSTKLPHQSVKYKIPVLQNPELEPFANYYFDVKWASTTPNKRAIKYHIPLELDGVGQEIQLKETSPNQFAGPKATAECTEPPSSVCMIHYKNLDKNPEAAKAAIINTYTDASFQLGRIGVMETFISDTEPDGVMTFEGAIHDK